MIYKVLDILTNQAVSGVYLYRGSKDAPAFSTFTDGQGFAEISSDLPFKISHIGYKDYSVGLSEAGNSVIYIEPVSYSLPEVVVTASKPFNFALWITLAALVYIAGKK
jgi:hypothetical protein